MDFLPGDIQSYVDAHTDAESPLLNELTRETHKKVLMSRMISGHLQGRVLAMLSHMIKPKHVLEIGTFTGYSALCLAEGLTEGGKIITIDKNEELETMVRKFIAKGGHENTIEYHVANAMDLVPALDGPFDLVFIDADKINYYNYFNLVLEKIQPGSFIIADNVLWSGKVVETGKKFDKDTQALLDFNRLVHADDRVEKVLFPIRDGLMVIRKI